MQIHQPVDLVLGLLELPLGIVGIVLDLRRVFTGTFKNRYADWRPLGLSLWFLSGGPAHLSRAFDLRHHESHTTSVLETIELKILTVILIANGLAWIIRRRQMSQEPVTEAVHPAT